MSGGRNSLLSPTCVHCINGDLGFVPIPLVSTTCSLTSTLTLIVVCTVLLIPQSDKNNTGNPSILSPLKELLSSYQS